MSTPQRPGPALRVFGVLYAAGVIVVQALALLLGVVVALVALHPGRPGPGGPYPAMLVAALLWLAGCVVYIVRYWRRHLRR